MSRSQAPDRQSASKAGLAGFAGCVFERERSDRVGEAGDLFDIVAIGIATRRARLPLVHDEVDG